jgi:hypothetical protein
MSILPRMTMPALSGKSKWALFAPGTDGNCQKLSPNWIVQVDLQAKIQFIFSNILNLNINVFMA